MPGVYRFSHHTAADLAKTIDSLQQDGLEADSWTCVAARRIYRTGDRGVQLFLNEDDPDHARPGEAERRLEEPTARPRWAVPAGRVALTGRQCRRRNRRRFPARP